MEEILRQAERLEKDYDWLGASELYKNALNMLSEEDFSRKGDVTEQLGYALYHAAFQAENYGMFRDRMRQSVVVFEKAKEFYTKLSEQVRVLRTFRCDAMIAYTGYWVATEGTEKRRLLDEGSKLTKEALKAYDESGDRLGYAKTCIQLAEFLNARLDLELDIERRGKILDEALGFGEKAIEMFSDSGDEHGLAEAFCIASINCFDAAMSLQLEIKRRECEKKTFDYAKAAIRISENHGDKFLLGRSTVSLAKAELDLGAGSDTATDLFKKALQCCNQAKDGRIFSEIFDGLAFSNYWSLLTEEDLEKLREKSKRTEEYASEAIRCSISVNYCQGIPHSYSFGYVANLVALARRETKLETRHELLRKAVVLGKRGLEHSQPRGSTHGILHDQWMLAQALCDLSTVATGVEKRHLLEEAMTLGEETVRYTEQLRPQYMLPQSQPYGVLANILFELGRLEEVREKRKELLEKSVSCMETCIVLLQKHLTSFPSRRELFAAMGNYLTVFGNILNHLYQTTGEKKTLRKLIETLQSAVQMNKKADLASRVAEAYWQTAIAYDRLEDHSESASNFEYASRQYELSSQSIHQLNDFYMDYAAYMRAWTEIETARDHHERQEYDLAKEHFEKAANLHKSLKHWSYLAPNYFAWARLEEAEELSRKEQAEEAVKTFGATVNLFVETKKALQAQFDKIETSDEKQMATNMLKAIDIRCDYCTARVALEEAKILERKGDHYLASQKYGSAAETFEKIETALDSEQERKEIGVIKSLSQAWQKMMLADARASPELYLEASELFEQASKGSYNESTGLQALGHSRFCKALEAGTRFADTRDRAMHAKAMQFLESAANYYAKAGFQKASEFVKATGLLFDAYASMDNAKKEEDHDKKAKLYAVAEKVLQTAAGSFMKAEHPEKREQVLRLLERVKEERELAVSITEVLHVPPIISTTKSFTAPASTSEEAVGSERFEQADVQANLIVRQKEMKVGENLSLEIELVNAGKGPAVLIKVNRVIPEGFELGEELENCRVEDSYIDMKGKRLGPLKTEELRLVLKPRVHGTFTLKPTILYLDESGKYKSHEPESVTIIVKELGIKGWIKGER